MRLTKTLPMKTAVVSTDVCRVDKGFSENRSDLLAVEEPLEIRIGFGQPENRAQKKLSVTMRTPGHDFELVLGFLFAEGIITKYNQVESIHYCESVSPDEYENVVRVELSADVDLDFEKLQRNFYTTSSCGVCGKSSIDSIRVNGGIKLNTSLSVSSDIVQHLPDKLSQHQSTFEYTGGLHAVALFDGDGEIKLVREDVGRHNAFDKIVGAALIKKMTPLSDSIVLLSGRASFELVQKAVVASVPILAAVGAPSSLAVDLAKRFGMTLLGFVRGERFNIYCGEGVLRRT